MSKLYLEHLAEYDVISVDTETTGLDWMQDTMFGVAIAAWDKKSDEVVAGYYDVREKPRILSVLNDQLPRCKKLVNHHAKFDAHVLRKAGVQVPLDRLECTMVRAALINENEGHSGRDGYDLDSLGSKYVNMHKHTGIHEELATMFGGKPTKEAQMKNLHRAPERVAAKYGIIDPQIALRLWLWQEEEIDKQQLRKVWGLEQQVTAMLVEVEEDGIRVDVKRTDDELRTIGAKIDKAQKALNKIAGMEVNANSPVQVRALFGAHKVGKNWFTDAGVQLIATDADNPSFDKDMLDIIERLGDPRAKAIQTLRKITKAQQFLAKHIMGHLKGDRVYPNYNQTRGDNELGTGTGRFSINNPAMQQIPARDIEIAEIVRPCFLPEKGDDWACADWEQFEFRWFAHYANEPAIIDVYRDNPAADFHGVVAGIVGIQRNARYAGDANAKQINLGLVFGMGKGEMAYQMGLDYTTREDERGRVWKNAGPKAEAIFATYHAAIPGVNKHLERASSIAKARGFVRSAMDRHLRFPGGRHTHKAGGLVLQSTAADSLKLKMVALHKLGKQYGFKYRLSVHDENNTSVPRKDKKHIVPIIKRELEAFGEGDPISCRVPILASIKTGANWWEACKKD